MIFTIVAIFAIVGAVTAAPVSHQAAQIAGLIPSGAGFKSKGTSTAGATADSNVGVSGAGLEGFGNVFSAAGPGAAFGFALPSPTL